LILPSSSLPLFGFLDLDVFFVILLLVPATLLVHLFLPLVRSEGPEEQARAQKVLVGCIIAGVLMAVAKPIAFWVTGWNATQQQGLPTELLSAVDNLLQLLMYIGVVVVIAGIIYGGIQLSHINSNKPITTQPINPNGSKRCCSKDY